MYTREILNEALDMSLDWGEHFLQPVTARLLAKYPQLTSEQASSIEAWTREVREFAFTLVEMEYEGRAPRGTARERLRTYYPEVSEELVGRLHNQGMYFAWKG